MQPGAERPFAIRTAWRPAPTAPTRNEDRCRHISAWRRSVTCRSLAMILRECRTLGLTRPAAPCPRRVNQLLDALPALEQASGPNVRAAVELLMDTGRPTEICKLGWDCLEQDADGKYALIYTDSKANKARRRMSITSNTAQMITGQQDRARSRYPKVPVGKLVLFPRSTRNREGKRPVDDSVVASYHHRAWVDSLPALRL